MDINKKEHILLSTNYYMNSNFDIPVEKLNEPGNLWIRPQNKQLRYSTDADKAASWLNPLPVYKASKEIKFGQPVSLTNYSQEHSISESGSRARTIMPTNALDNSSFIGIAIEYGEEKKEIHILNQGELVYEISKKDNPKYWLPPYHKNGDDFVFDWTDADVGSTVYITSSGSYTLNVDEVSGGNIMSVGKLVFAPKATETKEKQQRIIIHIQAGGDDRGVKDTAQFTVQMSSTIKPTSIESDYDQLIFVKINKDGLGEVIFNDDAITNDIESSPVGAIMIKSEDGLCDLTPIIGKKITLVRMGLISGNFGFSINNVGKIGLLNDGRVAFKSAKDYNIKVGLFKSYNGDTQDFLVDCRFPMEGAESGDKIGTIKPVFGPSDDPLLDIGYALVDNEIHRTTYIKNDPVDKSGIDWEDLIKNCYTKDIFEFGRKINGKYVFSRVLEDFNGKSWSLDIYDTDETVAILNPETFFKFRNLYYTINSDDGIKQVACQIKFNQDSINTNEECIWPEEAYKIKLKATSDKEDYVLGGKGPKSTLFCNISRLVAVGNYMDGNGSNIETYDITVKVKSTGQILAPGFYQNKDGKWCGYEWYIYDNNGSTYLYMSTIPSGVEAKDCNGINTIIAGEKLSSSDPEETLIVTVRRRPTLYNAVYLNQYPMNNPWMPYIDGNTGNLITENAIYFGSPSKLLSPNQNGDEDEATSGMEFNEAGRNGKIELTTEDSGKTITLSTQVRGATNTPIFKDKKQVIKSDGSIGNTIEWEYDFANGVTSLNSYFAPILISQNSSKENIDKINIDYSVNNELRATTSFEDYLADMSLSAIEILDTFYFRNIKYKDSSNAKSTLSIVIDDETDRSKYIFSELENDLQSNIYSIDSDSLLPYKDYLYVDNKYINYMSLLSLIGMSSKDLYNRLLKLERIINGADFSKRVESAIAFDDQSTDYINTIGLLRMSGYLNKSLALMDTNDIEKSKLVNSYLPNNGYASIVDRFVIENFYNYKNIEGLNDSYVDYRSKSFNERFNLVQDYTQQFGSNLARLTILYNDLNIHEYSYRIYDYFKYVDTNNSLPIENYNIYEGSTIEADKIVFKKNTSGYQSLCKDKVGFTFDNLKLEKSETEDIYEICSDENFNENETYYENIGNREFLEKKVLKKDYIKNRYYVKRTVPARYRGYPFRWPLYKDEAFEALDVEYNFFSKDTYGLDDSLTIYDNNPNRVLSSFSSQSLEGITFDTISKLSFLYSCFDKNHTFDSKMTWFLPFVADDGKDYLYELKRLSNTKSISAQNGKTYSAFITKDNKIIELGSLYYNAYKYEIFESNAFTTSLESILSYYNKYSDWRGSLLKDKELETGIKSSKNITIKIDLGDNKIYSFDVPDNREVYKKFIFLMTQGKLQRIKNSLNDAYLANKLYADFFMKDYVKPINISTEAGLENAKKSISNYIYSGINDEDLEILAKLSITPVKVGPNEEYKQLGSYSTIVSEIKSLRVVGDITLAEIRRFFNLIQSFNNPITGSKDNISGNSSLKALARLENDFNEYDGYLTSAITKPLNATENKTSVGVWCEHGKPSTKYKCIQSGEFISENKFTIYKLSYTSKDYTRFSGGLCDICEAEGQALYNKYHNPVKYSSGHLNNTDTSVGSFTLSVSPTSLAQSEANAFRTNYPTQYAIINQYFSSFGSDGTSISDINHPETGNFTILCARCKYALDLGYSITDLVNYIGGEEQSNSGSSIKWEDFGLIDYARAAAYGPKNIVFYNEDAYKEFNNILSSVDLKFNFNTILTQKISESNDIVDNYNKASLKVMWPSEINTFGQAQNSITYAKNDINSYLNIRVSDEAGEGDSGIINLKNSSKSRISLRDVNNLPDITVAELKQFLVGDKTICEKCGIDPSSIKDYNIDISSLESATNNWKIANVEFINTTTKTLVELRELQYNQIKAQNGKTQSENGQPIIATPVINISKEAIVYDLVQQGVDFKYAIEIASAALAQGEDITGGFISKPGLETTYGLLNSKFGNIIFADDVAYNSDLIGLSVHTSPKVTQKNINDFKLRELYDYNNIDVMIIASTNVDYNILLDKLDIIKNYIEEFFDHSDKILKDFSQVYKQVPVEIKGTTYIDDFVDSTKTNDNFTELKNSIDSINTTIKKSLPSASDINSIGSDNFTNGVSNSINQILTGLRVMSKYLSFSSDENTQATQKKEVKDALDAIVNSVSSSNFKTSIMSYIEGYTKKSSYSIDMTKPNKLDDVKVSKAFNLEKYNNTYDRKNTTGIQVEPYTYVEYLPEYSYLHTKPSDGLIIKKAVDATEVGGIIYHNNLKTTISHKSISDKPVQGEMFISHRTEVKEGFYLKGEQLPLPMVSLNISPDLQNQTQRLMYKPTYNDYASDYKIDTSFESASLKTIQITGSFPIIKIGDKEFGITSISKNVISGEAFDVLPNGLKIIPEVSLRVYYTYQTPDLSSYDSTTGTYRYYEQKTDEFIISIDKGKIYRNYIYHIELYPIDVSQKSSFEVVSASTYADITCNNTGLKNYQVDDDLMIQRIGLKAATSSDGKRTLPYDKELFNDVILNSDLFIYTPNPEIDQDVKIKDMLTLTISSNDRECPTLNEVGDMQVSKVKHISDYDFELIYR